MKSLALRLLFCSILMTCFASTQAQNLWLGINAGLCAPLSYGAERGTYFKGGVHDGQPMLDFEAQYLLANKLFVHCGFLISDYPLGLKRRSSNLRESAAYGYAGSFEVLDLRVGIGYDLRIADKIRFVPEFSAHGLLDRSDGYALGQAFFQDGTNIRSESYHFKPGFLPAISVAASFDIRFRNGMFFRMGCRLEAAFSKVARTIIEVRDANGSLAESYAYETIPMMILPNFGFHYPISRIWRGKPW